MSHSMREWVGVFEMFFVVIIRVFISFDRYVDTDSLNIYVMVLVGNNPMSKEITINRHDLTY